MFSAVAAAGMGRHSTRMAAAAMDRQAPRRGMPGAKMRTHRPVHMPMPAAVLGTEPYPVGSSPVRDRDVPCRTVAAGEFANLVVTDWGAASRLLPDLMLSSRPTLRGALFVAFGAALLAADVV